MVLIKRICIYCEGRGRDRTKRVCNECGGTGEVEAVLYDDLQAWFGEPMTEAEVEAALERYGETGLQFHTIDNPSAYYSWLWGSIKQARAALTPPDATVFLQPDDDLCERTDGFCPIKIANKDCRTCEFYLG